MSATGATLSGSYTGVTGTVDEVGFYYGTSQLSLGTKAAATGTASPFSKALTGLSAGTTYYYKAYATVEGTEDKSSTVETFFGSVESFTTKKVSTATVTTSAASSITSSSVLASGSFSGASGSIYEAGVVYGTNSSLLSNPDANKDALSWAYDDSCVGAITSHSISCSISGLDPETTYYYKAFVAEYNESTQEYDYRYGSLVSFSTTSVTPQPAWGVYLSDYGMPGVSSLGTSLRQSGTYTDRDDHWYSVNTSSNNRQIAIHTYTHPTSGEETLDYVVLFDGSKYAPVWTYHVMNSTQWPDNNFGRNESWTDDPAISLTQQGGLDNAGTVGYSRGHLVASDYRQTSVKQNKQTFYHSNQAPQWQNSFNSGVWSRLESRVKNQTPGGTTMLYVITGVLYEGATTTKPSGSLNVPIPSHFYKCIMKCTFIGGVINDAKGIAFVYTNEAHSGNYYDSAYVTSIDAIETRTGFDFFAGVPTALQASAEANTSHTWFTGQN
ncbi:MAG: DNA/RNA non-specific endonuclease [Bacteroidales bacterium]|nr:DNA/RNA non-specific endonuclease [Bacteroidales bacterium]